MKNKNFGLRFPDLESRKPKILNFDFVIWPPLTVYCKVFSLASASVSNGRLNGIVIGDI